MGMWRMWIGAVLEARLRSPRNRGVAGDSEYMGRRAGDGQRTMHVGCHLLY